MIVRQKDGTITDINIERYHNDNYIYNLLILLKFNIEFKQNNQIRNIIEYINQ